VESGWKWVRDKAKFREANFLGLGKERCRFQLFFVTITDWIQLQRMCAAIDGERVQEHPKSKRRHKPNQLRLALWKLLDYHQTRLCGVAKRVPH
jgi:hypothetical protein